MGDLAFRVQNLSKKYRVMATGCCQDMLGDQIMDSLKSLFSRNGLWSPVPGQPFGLSSQSLAVFLP